MAARYGPYIVRRDAQLNYVHPDTLRAIDRARHNAEIRESGPLFDLSCFVLEEYARLFGDR